jgi:ABC-2 type transport system ATP-binding protein
VAQTTAFLFPVQKLSVAIEPHAPETECDHVTTQLLAAPESPLEPIPPAVALEITGATKVFTSGRPQLPVPWRRTSTRKRITAVDHMSFSVTRGEIFGLLGPNGTGKSTLIRLVSTLLTPDEGTVTIFGFDVVKDEAAVKRLINRVSVDPSFFKKLSPMENLLYGARLYGVDANVARAKAVSILTRLGIEGRSIWSPMEDMSRGMQQKVAIARAFLTAPILLLLDEPTTGLDPHSRREVQAFVREIRDQHDATIILCTHDMNEADDLCDRIAVIDRGRIVALDTPAGLKALVQTEDLPAPTLEDIFLKLTGRKLEEDMEEKL